MSDNQHQNDNSQALPFFARYLEGQYSENMEDLSEEEMQEVQGGLKISPQIHTRPKLDEIFVSLKYPSDQEDGGHPPTDVSKKYPSDADEHMMTNAYPSDREDHMVKHGYLDSIDFPQH